MEKFKAIIFDMDGTLVDTAQIWRTCNKMFLINHHIYTDEIYDLLEHELHGLSVYKGVHIIKKVCNLSFMSDEDIIKEFQCLAIKYYELEIKYIKECENFVKKLLHYDIPIAIATNADDYGLEKINKIVNLSQYFKNHMYGISCVNNICKPSPDIFLYAAERLSIDPKSCIVIEDSYHGIVASKAAGMFTIGINTSGKKNMLIEADKIINCYTEIDLKDYFLLQKIH